MIKERRERALDALRQNKKGRNYTFAAATYYPHRYYFDSALISIARAKLGDIFGAFQELRVVFRNQNPQNGFISQVSFDSYQGHKFEIEKSAYLSNNESTYLRPPLPALAALEIHNGFLAEGLRIQSRDSLRPMYKNLELTYNFLDSRQKNPGSNLIVTTFHETHQETAPILNEEIDLDQINFSQQRFLNSSKSHLSKLTENLKKKATSWLPGLKDKEIMASDVMFNCVYADNLYAMADISKILREDVRSLYWKNKAAELEREILVKMWDDKDKMFYSIRPNSPLPFQKYIKKISSDNLFPLVLPNLEKEKIARILDLLEDNDMFNTHYPVPSFPIKNKEYYPNLDRRRTQIGSVDMFTNWYLVTRGLLKQSERFRKTDEMLSARCDSLARNIAQKSGQLVDNGYFEFYNPETGKPITNGMVQNFSVATLGENLAELATSK